MTQSLLDTVNAFPELGVLASVVMDSETHCPRTVSAGTARDYRDVGEGFIESIRIVSHWSAHVALYALQNPTPDNIARALELLWQSGDFEDWPDPEDGTKIGRVIPPPGWDGV